MQPALGSACTLHLIRRDLHSTFRARNSLNGWTPRLKCFRPWVSFKAAQRGNGPWNENFTTSYKLAACLAWCGREQFILKTMNRTRPGRIPAAAAASEMMRIPETPSTTTATTMTTTPTTKVLLRWPRGTR